MKFWLLSALLTVMVPLRASSIAPAIASFTNDGLESNAYYNINGYDFTNSADLIITALAVEITGSSLVDSHFVGIYNLDGTFLQVGATVAAGTSGDAQNFAYVDLTTPFTLAAGSWFIGVQYSQNSGDSKWTGDGSIQMASGITFDATDGFFDANGPVSASDPESTGFRYTQNFSGEGGRDSYIGPNFQFETSDTSAAPEPATVYLVAISLGLAAIMRRKRRA
jgi:hypothetical protein